MSHPFHRFPIAPALLALVLGPAGLVGCQPEAPTEPPAAAATPAAVVERFDATLSLVNNNGHVRYDGTVDSTASRQRILDVLQRAYGSEHVSGTIAVDPQARAPVWLDGLPEFIGALPAAGAAITFEGRQIELGGAVALPQRQQLLDRARAAYPDYDLGGLFKGLAADDTAVAPEARALASLKPGASPQQLVETLNGIEVRFDAGSARIDPDSLDILSRAAQAIAAAPAGTRLQLESRADDAALARQRAEAVKVQLILNGVSPAMIQTDAGTGPEGLAFSLAG